MNIIFLISVILKGIGALLEIGLQILITKGIGVSGYGNYTTWINAADLIFWLFFSGLIKCNTFYLSGNTTSIRSFRKNYYKKYVIPILGIVMIAPIIYTRNPMTGIVALITGLELLVLDNSSTLIVQGNMVMSLTGEYIIGRLFMVLSVLLMNTKQLLDLNLLLILYVFQYVLVFCILYLKKSKKKDYTDVSKDVSLKKWGSYQKADLMHSMIEQLPVVLQYFFAGAFEAGVVSIVLLVKKLINFISGPTAKIFLPEFSRLYKENKKKEIRSYYSSIMRIQMLAVGPLAIVLLGYPKVVLNILAEELTGYSGLFMICSVIFLLTATLGPCGGILQMTGNEKMDNRCREMALIFMIVIMVLTCKNSYFILYGLCGQVGIEAIAKYCYVCKWMEKSPIDLKTYLKWWSLPVILIVITYCFKLQSSFLWMFIMAAATFGVLLIQELKNKETNLFEKILGKKEGGKSKIKNNMQKGED